MRVIAGTARSIPLKTPEGTDTRPTTDRIKETLFNMLQFKLQGAVFADIFAGSGAIGIEALSRGAKKAFFVDNKKASIDVIEQNLKKCRLIDKAKIVKAEAADVKRYFPKLDKDERLIVFMDPPYGQGLELPVLKALKEGGLVNTDSTIILEEALNYEIDGINELGYDVVKIKKYKNQKHLFLELKQD